VIYDDILGTIGNTPVVRVNRIAPAGRTIYVKIEFFNPATGKTTPVATTEKVLARWIPSLTVSPDGKYMLYTQIDQQGSDLMLMENFR